MKLIANKNALKSLLAVVFLLFVVSHLFRRAMEDGLDLRVYLAGAHAFVAGGDLYAAGLPGTPYGGMAFTYPPFAAAVFAPLTLVPTHISLGFQTVANLVCALIVGCLITRYLMDYRLLHRPDGKAWWITAAFLTGIMLLLGPWRNSLSLGQINPLLMVLIVIDLLGKSKRHPRGYLPQGILTGLAAGIKLTPLVFLMYFVVRGDIKSALRMAATFTGTVVLMALLAPSLSKQYWFSSLGETSRVGALSRFENMSIRGFIARLDIGQSAGTALWIGASLTVIALGALAVYRTRHSPDQWGAVAATSLVMLLISPVSWGHHWVWVAILVPALLCQSTEAASEGFTRRASLRSPGHVICLLLLAGFAMQPLEAAQLGGSANPYASITFGSEMLVQSGLFVAVLALAWLALAARNDGSPSLV